ncbi:rhodanese-like domain-containing protein [Roseateles chitosanitabidus]|jgi:rhodanese-related sulfurtransferase|uniref:rhodanese-like domain-containing protein n=1 Tax=Roseateles chitosanitabidus TaxID=65048 RepID=UPI0008326616|nr:rhodanese-like domain-containing protein [Roseateles chitosanitabidus]MBO9685567.1 sulfurtransferase [Roseateles chitosanitabidus]
MHQLDVHQVAALASSAPRALLLDVREPWEVALARIDVPGLDWKHLPMGQVVDRVEELDPQQPVAVYCHHGVRSLQVVAFLSRQGFDVVYNLAGGIDAWSEEIDPSVPRY